jgi:hypothetical protein
VAGDRRRGRRAHLPEDTTPYAAPRVDVAARIAWLLRVHRLLSEAPGTESLRGFSGKLEALGVRADPARVSQWETAAVPVPAGVITAYETVLGLPSGQLLAVSEGLEHSVLSVRRNPAVTGSAIVRQRHLDDAYDRISDGEGRGGDWLTVSGLMTGRGDALMPTRIVQDLSLRLVNEMSRSVGVAYYTRFEALCRLAAGPVTAGAVVRSISAAVATPGAQSILDAMTVYGEVPQPVVVAHLVRIASHDGGRHRLGAVHALLNMVLMGTLPDASRHAVEALVVQLLAERGDAAAQELGRMLGERLPAESRRAIRRRCSVSVEPPVAPTGPRSSPPAVTATFVEGARAATGIDEDPMLARLLHEFLAGDFVERQHQAALLMLASPYRSALASTAIGVVQDSVDPETRAITGHLLTYLAGAEHAAPLALLLPTVPLELRNTVLRALTHASASPEYASLDALAGVPGISDSEILYAAGMSGHPDLHRLAADPTRPHDQRAGAKWWIDAKGAVRA